MKSVHYLLNGLQISIKDQISILWKYLGNPTTLLVDSANSRSLYFFKLPGNTALQNHRFFGFIMIWMSSVSLTIKSGASPLLTIAKPISYLYQSNLRLLSVWRSQAKTAVLRITCTQDVFVALISAARTAKFQACSLRNKFPYVQWVYFLLTVRACCL